MAIGRRTLFFGLAALICFALVPACPEEFRWLAWLTGGLAAFWAVLLALDEASSLRGASPVHPRGGEGEAPFAPPPPPGDLT